MYITIEELKEIAVGTRVVEVRSCPHYDQPTLKRAVISRNEIYANTHGILIDYELVGRRGHSCSTWYLEYAIDEWTIQRLGNPAVKFMLDESFERCEYSYDGKAT
jgi:hypothetical protein